jgi:4-carboxymuconolactone decarboxylase
MTADPDQTERGLARPVQQLSADQQIAMDEIVAGPRGECSGPFVPLLRSPELMTHLQRAGQYLRFGASLDGRHLELVVLMVARRWDQQFEWSFHCPLALRAGIALEDVLALARGERPTGLDEQGAAVWALVDELHRTTQVTDATYARAMAVLGEVAVVETVVTAGYYATLAMVMNTARTAAVREAPVPLLHLAERE